MSNFSRFKLVAVTLGIVIISLASCARTVESNDDSLGTELSEAELANQELLTRVRELEQAIRDKDRELQASNSRRITQITEDYPVDSYLVEAHNMLPNGFVRSEGYLRRITARDIGMEDGEISDGLVFYITDRSNPLNDYIAPLVEEKIFFHMDTQGNYGLTVRVEDSAIDSLLAGSHEDAREVLLTLHDIFPMSAPVFVPFASVYETN